jgi:metal-responsive CopG/Arc/MetJ family transcriptional regulator
MAKVRVSLPEGLVKELDADALRRSLSRGALIAVAARRELNRPDPEAIAAAVARSEERFATAGSFDAAELLRRERDTRR